MREITFDSYSAIDEFDEIIDVRSPAEFEEDHVPNAINLPVLDNSQRVIVGTLHREVGEFEARKRGAALISTNIAGHLDRHFASKPKTYQPVVYCWRGGQRSKSLATILNAIGWRAAVIHGGYKSYRAYVRKALVDVCAGLRPVILTGLTGSGKTRILRRMQELGSPQVLDLEGLANHRGSLLGNEVNINNARQPTQKGFESLLLEAADKLDLAEPVFVESESKRIGSVSCPEILWSTMLRAPVVRVEVPLEERARFLVEQYDHFVREPDELIEKLPVLKKLHGAAQIDAWIEMARAGTWLQLSQSLLAMHYDPSYRRCSNYAPPAATIPIFSLNDAGIDDAVEALSRHLVSPELRWPNPPEHAATG